MECASASRRVANAAATGQALTVTDPRSTSHDADHAGGHRASESATNTVTRGRFGLPTPQYLAEHTPPTRDRAIDVLRIGSLLVVVAGHGLMLLVIFDKDGLHLDNLLGHSEVFQAFTWLLQVLPLFFFAGAAASLHGAKSGRSWGAWLFSRTQRLYRPVFYYLAFWLFVGLPLLTLADAPTLVAPVILTSVQLLWFLGLYLVVLATLPLLGRITTARSLWTLVGGLCVVMAAVDAIRLSGYDEFVGVTNFLWVWLIPAVLGVGYAQKLISRRTAAYGALIAFVVDIALVSLGPYELSLVSVPGQRLSNMTPPSLLLAGHCVVLCLLAIAVAPWLDRWARRARVWWAVAVGNSGAMTLYLWHLPALMIVMGVSHALGHDRSFPGQPGFVQLLFLQMIVFFALTALLFLLLLPLEDRPLPWWDAAVAEVRGPRSVIVGVSLTLAGMGTLGLAGLGLTPPGILVVAIVLALLAVARAVTLRASWARVRRTAAEIP